LPGDQEFEVSFVKKTGEMKKTIDLTKIKLP
jgi:hypothetical protein